MSDTKPRELPPTEDDLIREFERINFCHVNMKYDSDRNFQYNHTVLDKLLELQAERAKNQQLIKMLKQTSKLLDGIKYDLEASVYTLTDDEFETIFYVRDLCDEVLEENKD